jgi:hypothetical protein
MEGASAEARGGRMPLVEREGSNEAAMMKYHRRYSMRVLVLSDVQSLRRGG